METTAMLTSNSCLSAAEKRKFPEEWIPQGDEQFLISEGRPDKGPDLFLSKLMRKNQIGCFG